MEIEITDPVTEAARKTFNIPYLFPIQRYVIANILDGVHQIAVLPTGSGKSLCFQLPAILLPGVTFIIVPLLSLMVDQARRFQEKGITCGSIKGEQSEEERQAILEQIKSGKLKIIFITPESLSSPRLEGFWDSIEIEHLVIDEAHCVTEWGNTFRPAYLEIGAFVKARQIKKVSAFTATASENVINSIKQHVFGDLPVSVLIENPDRTNIHYAVIPVLSKARALTRLISEKKFPMLIFTRSRVKAEDFSRLLRERFPLKEVYFYHAGLTAEERKTIEKWFMQTEVGILVATSAFGLGIDKQTVRSVIHAEVPYSVEAYLQESGRAGRDRKPSEAVLVYSPEDLKFGDRIDDEVLKERYNNFLLYTRSTAVCRRETLLGCMGYEPGTECSGCDVCEGKAATGAEGKRLMLNLIGKHKRIFTKREIALVLKGKQTYEVTIGGLDRFKEFGTLEDWEFDDIMTGIECLLEEGLIRIPEKGFWKHRVTVTGKKKQFQST